MKKLIVVILSLFLIIGFNLNVDASSEVSNSITDLKAYESDNFVVFYPAGYKFQAREATYYLEKYLPEIEELTGGELDSKIPVTLEDIGAISNGYADPVNNKIGLFTNQPEAGSTLSTYESWYRLLSVHELIHIAHLNNSSDYAKLHTDLFGNFLNPNLASPLWVIEGIAVYGESQLSPYEGRLNDGYYDSIVATKAAADELPSISEITYSHDYFPRGQQYLYGSVFFDYLADEYGVEKFAELFDEYGSYYWAPVIGDFFPTLGLDMAANEVYGARFPELYEEFKEFKVEKNKDWKLAGEEVLMTDRGYLSNLTAVDEKIYYFAAESLNTAPFTNNQVYNLVEYDTQKQEKEVLASHLQDNQSSIEVKEDYLYYATGDVELGYPNVRDDGRGKVNILQRYNFETGEGKEVFKTEFKDFTVLDNGAIIYTTDKKNKHGSEIWRYVEGEKEKLGVVDELISEISNYNDELYVVSKGNISTWGIHRLDLDELSLEQVVATRWPEEQISFKQDKLYYIANYEGYKQMYSYDLLTGEINQLTEEGHTHEGVIVEDELYLLSNSKEGMGLFKQEKESRAYDMVESEQEERSVGLTITELDTSLKHNENAMRQNLSYLLKPSIRMPFLLGGQDALGLNQYELGYSFYGLNFSWQTKMLQPLTISFTTRGGEEARNTNLNFSYPVYRSRDSGLSAMNLNLTTNFNNLLPGVGVRFSYPQHRVGFDLQTDLADFRYSTRFNYSYLLDNGSINFDASLFDGVSQPRDQREFSSLAASNSGVNLSLDYTHKLFELRKGLWNPNIFLADIYGNLFIDSYLVDGNVSGGYELLFEMGAGNKVYSVPKIGFAVSDELNIEPHFGFDVSF